MLRAFCQGDFDAFCRHLQSRMGVSCSRSKLLADARIFIIAAAIGAMASAAVCCSLIHRPAAQASIAERTLVHAVDLTAGAGTTTDALPLQQQSAHWLVPEPRRAEDPGAMSRSGSPAPDVAAGTLPAHQASESTSLAESPKTMAAETLTARASADERATASLASEAPSALKAPIKKSRALARGVPRYSVYAAARYQSRYGARERGSYGFLSGNGSYGDRD